jgi:TRAP-type C4-dicarboxylate transport system substrate-binding protein
MIVWPQAMGGFKLCEAAPHTLDADLGSASVHALNVNKDVWQGLPSEVQDALLAASESWDKEQLRLLSEGAEKGLARCRNEFGMTYTRMSPEDKKAWAFGLPNLAQEWAKNSDSKGLPGTSVLKAYMDAMRAEDSPVRNWDRE